MFSLPSIVTFSILSGEMSIRPCPLLSDAVSPNEKRERDMFVDLRSFAVTVMTAPCTNMRSARAQLRCHGTHSSSRHRGSSGRHDIRIHGRARVDKRRLSICFGFVAT